MASGVEAKPLHSTYSSMSVFSGEPYLARAAPNCSGTPPGAVRQAASNRPRLVPKRWISVAGTTPASLATSARVRSTGLRPCITRMVAIRMASSEVWRGRGDIVSWFFPIQRNRREDHPHNPRAGALRFFSATRHARPLNRITEWLFIFHLTLMNGDSIIRPVSLRGAAMAETSAYQPPELRNCVALVAGATRGVGRGIALALGEAGATVYCTGRSTRAKPKAGAHEPRKRGQACQKLWPADYYAGRPETTEETAELVTARGGKGIAVVVDHLEPEQVEKLIARVRA